MTDRRTRIHLKRSPGGLPLTIPGATTSGPLKRLGVGISSFSNSDAHPQTVLRRLRSGALFPMHTLPMHTSPGHLDGSITQMHLFAAQVVYCCPLYILPVANFLDGGQHPRRPVQEIVE